MYVLNQLKTSPEYTRAGGFGKCMLKQTQIVFNGLKASLETHDFRRKKGCSRNYTLYTMRQILKGQRSRNWVGSVPATWMLWHKCTCTRPTNTYSHCFDESVFLPSPRVGLFPLQFPLYSESSNFFERGYWHRADIKTMYKEWRTLIPVLKFNRFFNRGAVVAHWIRPQTLRREVPGSNLLALAVVSLGKTLYPHCLVPRKGLKPIGPLVACL